MIETLFGELQVQVRAWAPKVGVALLMFAGFWLAGMVVRRLIVRLASKSDVGLQFIFRMVARVVSTALLLFGAVTALGTMGVDVSALVAGLGLTGFALGFAMKDILSNLMSGLLILLYRPFSVNDHITVTGLEGQVTEIDLRYTRLEKGQQVYLIPNSLLITNTIGLTQAK
ncbi:MAG TPA: mechanosensitive ion channel domain-containing protein [Nitrospiraceae bacterium]|nr:mechanosensitive ion channel domain-containing protein [Nitrospiraceae bacterium]